MLLFRYILFKNLKFKTLIYKNGKIFKCIYGAPEEKLL